MSGFNQEDFNNLVYKKIQGAPFTNISLSATLEAPGSSNPKIFPKDIWSQPIPANVPLNPAGIPTPSGITSAGPVIYNGYTVGQNIY